MDSCEVVDVPDGKDPVVGVGVRHALKLVPIYDRLAEDISRSSTLLFFCCRSHGDKDAWLAAFLLERRIAAAGQSTPTKSLPLAARASSGVGSGRRGASSSGSKSRKRAATALPDPPKAPTPPCAPPPLSPHPPPPPPPPPPPLPPCPSPTPQQQQQQSGSTGSLGRRRIGCFGFGSGKKGARVNSGPQLQPQPPSS